jgi:hypothetical protein
LKNGASGAKGKQRKGNRDRTKAVAKSAKAERKAERRVAELRALLIKAESKLARRSARAAALLSEAMPKHSAPAESVEESPPPVVVDAKSAAADSAPGTTPSDGERDPSPSMEVKRPAGRAVKHGTAPVSPAAPAPSNHHTPKGNRDEAAPADKVADDGA